MEDNIEEYLHDLGSREGFLKLGKKPFTVSERFVNLSMLQLRMSVQPRHIKRVKGQVREGNDTNYNT